MLATRLLITGALGHIGSKFIHSLKPSEFEEVRLIDNLSTQRYSSLFNLPSGLKFKFIEKDICCAELEKYFKDIDIVIHFAAITDAASSFAKAEQVENVNFYGTQKVAMACVKNGCKLLFPSTTSVYGVQEGIVDEDCSAKDLKPQSPYAESKLKAENCLLELGRSVGLKFIICRLGTIFGTSIGMRFHTAINKFCWQAVMRQPITVWQTAMHQKRPYLDITDAVESFRFIIQKELFSGNVFNILTMNTTVKEIIDIISSYILDISIQHVDSEIMNQLSYTVSNNHFKELGFEFKNNLEREIGETINILKSAYYNAM